MVSRIGFWLVIKVLLPALVSGRAAAASKAGLFILINSVSKIPLLCTILLSITP